MKEMKKTNFDENSVMELLNRQYLEAEGQNEVNYWDSLARIIMEAIESRNVQGLSQADLAFLMKTKQSVISRFENMGRKPNYDFIARLSIAFGHAPGMTLYGEYMAVVPQDKHQFVKRMTTREGVSTQKLVDQLLGDAIEAKEAEEDLMARIRDATVESQSSTVDVNAEIGDAAATSESLYRGSKTCMTDLPQHLHPDQDEDERVFGKTSAAGTHADRRIA